MEPLISVLLPTRARTAKLAVSFDSLLGRARHPEQIELCIAYDDDDDESHDYFTGPVWAELLSRHGATAQVHRLPRWGYRDLHLYLNYLADRSQGRWLFFWGDDAVMETEHWDDHVRADPDWVGLLHITASNAPMNCSILPLFHRGWVDLFGCVTPINPADSWISDICWRARARRAIPVTVYHARPEDSDAEPDQTYIDKKNAHGWNREYHLPEYVQMRSDWAQKLAQYVTSPPV